MLTKRFLLFVGDDYYAAGGWNDFVDQFDTADAAIEHMQGPRDGASGSGEWAQIVDTRTLVVREFEAKYERYGAPRRWRERKPLGGWRTDDDGTRSRASQSQ